MTTQSNYLAVRPTGSRRRRTRARGCDLPIVDAHHHFYERPGWIYMLDDYLQDARSGQHPGVHAGADALSRLRQPN